MELSKFVIVAIACFLKGRHTSMKVEGRVVYLVSQNLMITLIHSEENKVRSLLHITKMIHFRLIKHLSIKRKL